MSSSRERTAALNPFIVGKIAQGIIEYIEQMAALYETAEFRREKVNFTFFIENFIRGRAGSDRLFYDVLTEAVPGSLGLGKDARGDDIVRYRFPGFQLASEDIEPLMSTIYGADFGRSSSDTKDNASFLWTELSRQLQQNKNIKASFDSVFTLKENMDAIIAFICQQAAYRVLGQDLVEELTNKLKAEIADLQNPASSSATSSGAKIEKRKSGLFGMATSSIAISGHAESSSRAERRKSGFFGRSDEEKKTIKRTAKAETFNPEVIARTQKIAKFQEVNVALRLLAKDSAPKIGSRVILTETVTLSRAHSSSRKSSKMSRRSSKKTSRKSPASSGAPSKPPSGGGSRVEGGSRIFRRSHTVGRLDVPGAKPAVANDPGDHRAGDRDLPVVFKPAETPCRRK